MNSLRRFYMKNDLHASGSGVINTSHLAGAFILLLLLFITSICVGAVKIPLSDLIGIISTGDTSDSLGQVLMYVRLPRTLAAALAGMALSVSGGILQTVLNNSMCSPNIIGVNSGAGLFMILTVTVFPGLNGVSPVAAFLGAMFATAIVYFIAMKTGASKLAIVLAGIAVSSLLSALTDTVTTIFPDAKINRADFLIGSFSGVTMSNVVFALPYIVIGLIAAIALSYDMNILALGDSTALSLGMRTELIRCILLINSALLAGAAISLSGLIGFVGLIIPHAVKFIIGYDNRYSIPMNALLGGAFCLGCDILSRILFVPYELPVGIIMSLIGSPFFIYLILKSRRRTIID